MKHALLAAIFVIAMGFSAAAERRVALVLSADGYRTIRPLENAGNDGLAVKAALEALDFDVVVETDRDLRRMRRALDDFREDAKGADVALVFFAGHGVEIAGENRLLPVDADASSIETLKATSLPLEEVRKVVAEVGRIGLILLDACRNDPFGVPSGAGRSAAALKPDNGGGTIVRPGLGRIGRAENILFAFSAAPGETASDGTGGNSPFTTALARYLGTEGLEIRSVLTLVQQEVYDLSRGRQLPYVESGLPQLFFAASSGDELPERERLLLAMADITPGIRDTIERIAVERDMPLAPLYGALLSSDAMGLGTEERNRKLAEAADAFVKVRDEMRVLASDDPRVTQLRLEAERQLSLGAFDTVRARLAEAADIDAASRKALKENYVGRTLSEAATRYLSGGAARADLRYELAIADYEKAEALFAEVDGEDISADDRLQQMITLEALGDVHATVGNLAAAGRAFEELHRVSTRRAATDPGNQEWQRDLSVSHTRIGDVRIAQGDLAGALEAYRASLDVAMRLAAADPGNAQWQRDLSVDLTRIGDVRIAQGDLAGALDFYWASLEIAARLVDADPGNAQWQSDLSISQERIGDVRRAQGDLAGALEAYGASLDIAARLADADPGNTGWQRDLSVSHNKIGDVRTAQGDLPGALEAYRASLDVAIRLAAADPGNAGWQRDLSVSYTRIGDVRGAQGDLPGALEAYRAGLDIRTQLAASDPGNAEWQRDLSVIQERIGDVRRAQGDLPGALADYRAGLDIRTRLAAADPGNMEWQRDLSISQERIGDVRREQGDLPGALDAYRASLDVAVRLAAADPGNAEWQRDLSVSHNKIGDVRRAQGNLPDALEAYRAGLDIRTQLATADPGNAEWQRDLSASHERIGDVRRAQGDLPGALAAYRASLDIAARLAAADPGNAQWQRDLMVSHVRMAQAGGDGRLHLRKALDIAGELERTGSLAPADGFIPGWLRQELGKLDRLVPAAE